MAKPDVKIVRSLSDHSELRDKIRSAVEKQNVEKWDLAEMMWRVKDDCIFHHWGYRNYNEYCDVELSMLYRTAQFYFNIHDKFVVDLRRKLTEGKAGSDKVAAEKYHDLLLEKLRAVGWTKARLLLDIYQDNRLEEEIAAAKNMTTRELKTHIREKIAEAKGQDPAEKVYMMSFGCYEGQRESVLAALEMAKRISGSDAKSNNLALICQDYVATNMIQEGAEFDKSIKLKSLDKFAAMLGVRLIVVDKSTRTVISGSTLLKQIANK